MVRCIHIKVFAFNIIRAIYTHIHKQNVQEILSALKYEQHIYLCNDMTEKRITTFEKQALIVLFKYTTLQEEIFYYEINFK